MVRFVIQFNRKLLWVALEAEKFSLHRNMHNKAAASGLYFGASHIENANSRTCD